MNTTDISKIKSQIGALLFSGILVIGRLSAAEQPSDVINSNSGFEEGTKEEIAAWEAFSTPAKAADGVETTAQRKQDKAISYSGNASAYVHNDGPRWAGWQQSVSVEPLTKYRLTAFTRASPDPRAREGVKAAIAVLGKDGDTKEMFRAGDFADFSSDQEWVKISCDFTTPRTLADNNLLIEIRCLPLAGGKPVEAWFDDVTLVRLEGAAN